MEFIENYLLTNDGLRMVNNDKPLGAVAREKRHHQHR
ncbi:maltose ABC transporter periplasmic protein [Vibrio cholerae]|nr:maltose ABC transporter periplasmic protein [Vibrio cholerae]